MAFMVHVIGHLSDFLELLPLEPVGPELHRNASKLDRKIKCSVLWKFSKVSPIIRLSKVKLLISYRQSVYAN